MEFPSDRRYHQEHLWAKENGSGIAVIGISDFAQDQLGKIIFADLPVGGRRRPRRAGRWERWKA